MADKATLYLGELFSFSVFSQYLISIWVWEKGWKGSCKNMIFPAEKSVIMLLALSAWDILFKVGQVIVSIFLLVIKYRSLPHAPLRLFHICPLQPSPGPGDKKS